MSDDTPVTRAEFDALTARVDALDGGGKPLPTALLTVVALPQPGAVNLGWVPNPAKIVSTITDGRDGTDTAGSGPWSTVEASPLATGRTFDKLIPGQRYTFTVTARYTDGTTEVATVAGLPSALTPVPPVVVPPVAPNRVNWSSGVWTHGDAAMTTTFESFRNQKLGNVLVFTSRANWNAQLSLDWKAGIPKDVVANLVIKVPLWTEDADPGTKANWTALANQVASVDAKAWVGVAWEMNIKNGYNLTPANRTTWINQYRQAVTWMQAAQPGLRFFWNPNAGPDQTGVDSRAVFQSLKDLHTGFGPDSYDQWPPDNDAAGRKTHLTATGYLGESYVYAIANGMQFVLPEWGVTSGTASAGHQGGDNPQYINDYLGFLKTQQTATVKLFRGGKVVQAIGFESYFNEDADYFRSDWTSNPKAAAAYRAQFFVS